MSERTHEARQGEEALSLKPHEVIRDGREARELLELFKLEEAQQDDVGPWQADG